MALTGAGNAAATGAEKLAATVITDANTNLDIEKS